MHARRVFGRWISHSSACVRDLTSPSTATQALIGNDLPDNQWQRHETQPQLERRSLTPYYDFNPKDVRGSFFVGGVRVAQGRGEGFVSYPMAY